MNPAVASILRRVASIAVGASAASQSTAASITRANISELGADHAHSVVISKGSHRSDKLIFGKARRGHPLLAYHGSHSSHSSHASHYSASSGGSYSYPSAVPSSPPPAPPPAQPTSPAKATNKSNAPIKRQPAAGTNLILDRVLKKLPQLRSRWPFEAKLTKQSQFRLYNGDKVVGVVILNAGTTVAVLAITPRHAIIEVSGNESPIPVMDTDIVDRMGGADKILAYPDDPGSDKLQESKTQTKQ